MRLLFLNQYFPPDPAPTGVLFAELADECRARGHEVDFVDAGQDYRGGQKQGGRMKRELAALRRMVAAGKARPRADVVISGSSPPCLAVFADRVARKHRARHLHWAMDVYPEIAVALGEVKAGSLVARLTGWLMGRAYRRCASVIALDADMRGVLARHRVNPEIIRPWVFRGMLEMLEKAVEAGEGEHGNFRRASTPESPFSWVYSGNLGRAHEYETLLRAQQLLEQRGIQARLVFQGGGPGTESAQALARELRLERCEWKPYAPETELVSSLLGHDILVVTQKPETRGLLWPSKLGLVTALPRPLVFVGPTDGAIATELREYPATWNFAIGEHEGLAAWIGSTDRRTEVINARAVPSEHRVAAISEWIRLIEGNL